MIIYKNIVKLLKYRFNENAISFDEANFVCMVEKYFKCRFRRKDYGFRRNKPLRVNFFIYFDETHIIVDEIQLLPIVR